MPGIHPVWAGWWAFDIPDINDLIGTYGMNTIAIRLRHQPINLISQTTLYINPNVLLARLGRDGDGRRIHSKDLSFLKNMHLSVCGREEMGGCQSS
jgi:hypothetical protein